MSEYCAHFLTDVDVPGPVEPNEEDSTNQEHMTTYIAVGVCCGVLLAVGGAVVVVAVVVVKRRDSQHVKGKCFLQVNRKTVDIYNITHDMFIR